MRPEGGVTSADGRMAARSRFVDRSNENQSLRVIIYTEGSECMELTELTEMVRRFHEKHDFANNNGSDMNFRMLLMMEEIGELCECITKGKSREELEEELADVFILLLGHCVVLDVNLEEVFLRKMERVMNRKAIKVKDGIRVTEFRGEGTEEV